MAESKARLVAEVDPGRTRDFLAWLIEQSQKKKRQKPQLVKKGTDKAA